MHKSLTTYANALNCTPGQVRRYIREGHIPSAVLEPAPIGRPFWVIRDESEKAIEELRRNLRFIRRRTPVFHEPVRQTCIWQVENAPPSARETVFWQPVFLHESRDFEADIFDRIYRFSLLRHRLTTENLRHPPTYVEMGLRRLVPQHGEIEKAHRRTVRRFVLATVAPRNSFRRRWIKRKFGRPPRKSVSTEAARQLGRYHRSHGVEINYKNLAAVLGFSKSKLYRKFTSAQIKEALVVARKLSVTPTQKDRNDMDRAAHPGIKYETAQQAKKEPKDLPTPTDREHDRDCDQTPDDLSECSLTDWAADESPSPDQRQRAKQISRCLSADDMAWFAQLPEEKRSLVKDYFPEAG
jgi:hypothetical protein